VDLLALTTGDAIIIIVFVTIPIAAFTFAAGAGKAFDQIGKGQFSVEFESDLPQKVDDTGDVSAEVREAEIRQLLEAKAYRQQARGEAPLDIEGELTRLMADEGGGDIRRDAQLREEVRQLVVARNERRQRQGKDPLDVQSEIERQLRELENLGQ
jgi:hypothetical protein